MKQKESLSKCLLENEEKINLLKKDEMVTIENEWKRKIDKINEDNNNIINIKIEKELFTKSKKLEEHMTTK